MKYAKLCDGELLCASNPVIRDGICYGNPSVNVLKAEGYKPVVYTDEPCPAPVGYYWTEQWAEDDVNIVQTWVLKPYEDIPADIAMEILFGGETNDL